MKKTTTQIKLNDIESRYRVAFESEICEAGSYEYKVQQLALLRSIVDNPGLLDCGTARFQTMKMWHDGMKWVVEMEAVSA